MSLNEKMERGGTVSYGELWCGASTPLCLRYVLVASWSPNVLTTEVSFVFTIF